VKRLLAIVAALALIAAIATWWALWARPGPAKGPHTVIVAEGTSLYKLADQLVAERLVPGSPETYRVMARVFGSSDPIQAGEFSIPAGTGGAGVLNILQHGRPLLRLITVPEGTPSIIVYEKLMASPYLTGPVEVPAEGSILPDSYSYQRGETRAAVAARMQQAMSRLLDRLWSQRKPQSVVHTRDEAIILASIVEKETGKPAERKMVAGVYSNRLRQGIKLDADPTVIYPITHGKPLSRTTSSACPRAFI